MSELKSCPFCGGDAKMDEWYIKGTPNRIHYRVRCKNGCCMQYNEFHSFKKAAETWNARAERVAHWEVRHDDEGTYGVCSNCRIIQRAGMIRFCYNCGYEMKEDV